MSEETKGPTVSEFIEGILHEVSNPETQFFNIELEVHTVPISEAGIITHVANGIKTLTMTWLPAVKKDE